MFDIRPDDLVNKTDMLLYEILEELKQLNKSLRPIAKDTEIKKPKQKSKPKQKVNLSKPKNGGASIVSDRNSG